MNKTNQVQLANVRLLGGDNVAIGIKNGQIIRVGERQDWPNTIDGKGHLVFPGRIDSHVHGRNPGQTHKEDLETIQQAAIAGGTTTIFDMANTNPCITTADRWLEKRETVKQSRITYHQWFGATPNNYGEFKKIAHLPDCFGAKLCMANTTGTGEMLVDKREDQLTWSRLVAEYGKVLTVHAENEARITRNIKRLKKQAAQRGLPLHCEIRDAMAEEEAIQQIIDVAFVAGCRLNICHVSTANGSQIIKRAASSGAPITFELCPQYWRLTQRDLEGKEGWRAKCNPSVRTSDDARCMEAHLCDHNLKIGFVATDHAPHRSEEKEQYHPDPFSVPSGMPGLDTATSLCWELVHQGKIARRRFVDITARFPAAMLGLKTKGEITAGFDADLMLIDEKRIVTFRDEDMLTKCGWTPFRGMAAHGQIKLVIAKGHVLLNRL